MINIAEYIKLNNEWVEILDVYRKDDNNWTLKTDIQSSFIISKILL